MFAIHAVYVCLNEFTTVFILNNRFLQRTPIPFLHSAIIGSIIDCALMACSLDHRDANVSVMKFFYDLLHSGRNHEVS